MILWKKEWVRDDPTQGIVFKRHEAEWILPPACASYLKYNPRHLPVVIERRDNEYFYLRMAIRRTIRGYRALRTYFPPSPFLQE